MSDPSNRARVERLLRGERRTDDLTRLFLYIRDRCDGRESVQEIGDFVAHHDERTKGLVTRCTRDWAVSATYAAAYLNRPLNFSSLPPYYPKFLEASSRRLPSAQIAKLTGHSLKEVHKLLPRAIGRLASKPDGSLTISSQSTEADRALMWGLSQILVVQSAFDSNRLFDDFAAALRSNGILHKGEMTAFEEVKTFVTLFAVTVMHGCVVRLDGDKAVRLNAITDFEGVLKVEAAVKVLVPDPTQPFVLKSAEGAERPIAWPLPVEDREVVFSSGIFDTDMLAKDCCEEALLSSSGKWDFPIELSGTGKISKLE